MGDIKKTDEPEKIKISNNQIFSLAAGGAIGGTIIISTGLLASIAKRDAWITALIAPILGVLIIRLYCYLGGQYPGMTIIGIAKQIFGKWLGFIISAGFVFFFLIISSHIIWHVGDFTGHIYYATPEYVINGFFIIGIIIAVLYGVEAFARASELFIYFISVIFFTAMLLILPRADIANLQPVLEEGIVPSIKGIIIILTFLPSPLLSLMMIFPKNVHDLPQAGKAFVKGYLWASLIIFVSIIMSLLVLGSNISARSQYTTYLLFKEIDIAGIFSRLEFLIAIIWLITQFVVGVLFFYASSKGLAELLGLKDYRKIVLPLGLIILVLSGMFFADTVYQANWDSIVLIPYALTFSLCIPLIMLLVLMIKKKFIRRR